jgi:hypothetical protein
MGSFIWTLVVAAGAALIWRLSRRSGRLARTGSTSPAAVGISRPPAPAGGGPAGAVLREAAARTGGTGAEAAEPEPIDGWTQSAADTAATDPLVEEQYIEDISVAPHAAPIDPGSEPSPWRTRSSAAPSPTSAGPAEGNRAQAGSGGGGKPAEAGAAGQDMLDDVSEWAGDDGERLADPGSGEAGAASS